MTTYFLQIVGGFAGFIEEPLTFGKVILIAAKLYIYIYIKLGGKGEHSKKCSQLI